MKRLLGWILVCCLLFGFWELLEWAFLDRYLPKTSAIFWTIRILFAVALGLLVGSLIKRLFVLIQKKRKPSEPTA